MILTRPYSSVVGRLPSIDESLDSVHIIAKMHFVVSTDGSYGAIKKKVKTF